MRFGWIAAVAACVMAVPASAATVVTLAGTAAPGQNFNRIPLPPLTTRGTSYISVIFDRPVEVNFSRYTLNIEYYLPEEGPDGPSSAVDTALIYGERRSPEGISRGYRANFDLSYLGGPYDASFGNYVSVGRFVGFFDGISITNPSNVPVNYVITAGVVPEPASWAMMIGGMGVMGGSLRQRRNNSQPVTGS